MTPQSLLECAFMQSGMDPQDAALFTKDALGSLQVGGFQIVPVEVVTALRPFADALPRLDAKCEQFERLGMGKLSDNASTGMGIKFGHIRAAAAALAKLGEQS